MKTLVSAAIALSWLAIHPAHAVLGCLSAEDELAKRADTVVLGRIVEVGVEQRASCPAPIPDDHGWYRRSYPRCGAVMRFSVSVSQTLRGAAGPTIVVLVPRPSLNLGTCDDRPEPERMAGQQAILFLESSNGQYWAVDGPDGIYPEDAQSVETDTKEIRRVLDEIARQGQ